MVSKIAAWVLDNIPLPSWAAPYVFGLMIGRMPHKAPDPETKPPRRKIDNCIEHLSDLPTTYAPDRPTNSGRDQQIQDQLARNEWLWNVAGWIALLALIAGAAWITWGAMPTQFRGH